MRIYRTSKRAETKLSRRFEFVPDPNIICTRIKRPVGSESRSKQWSYKKNG